MKGLKQLLMAQNRGSGNSRQQRWKLLKKEFSSSAQQGPADPGANQAPKSRH
jgi:hypothetical protein